MFCSRCGTEVQDQAKFCPSCGLDLASTTPLAAVKTDEATEADLVRDALKDEYEIMKELGRGGMAIVFKAKEKALDREVAVKVLPFSLAFDQEFVERFQREARTAAKLEHPHIIPIYRVGKSGRVIYFVMKFLRGKSLSEIIEARGALPPDDIRKLLIQTIGALGYAHKNGIVHRDIKPDNIMFDESANAIVTDFGIAKAASGTRLTGTGMAIGTPHYMSPEQARAQPLDGRSDIYSLGVVAFQCLTGQVPFDGEDSFAIGYKHIMEEVPTPPLKNAAERDLFAVIKRMMAKSPDDRFQAADEMIAVLEGRSPPPRTQPKAAVSADAPTTVMPATPPGTRPSIQTTPTTPMPRAQPAPPAVKKKRSGVLVGMFMLLLLGGGGGAYYFLLGPGAQGHAGNGPSPQTTATAPVAGAPTQLAAADSGKDTTGAATPSDTTSAVPEPPKPNYGWIVLRNLPTRGATAKVDGEEKTGTILQVPPGSRKVTVDRLGYETFSSTVVVTRGDTVPVTVSLKAVAAKPAARPSAGRERTQALPETPSKDYCSDPGADYNADGSCYDTQPSISVVPVLPRPAAAPKQPSPVTLWVRVGVDGKAKRVLRQQDSDVLRFTIEASRFAQGLDYKPAQKDGAPVEAWFRLSIRSR